MTPEDQYWHDRSALLDPLCYDYVNERQWSLTVPAGETWYALNLWNVSVNGAKPYFHRRLDVNHAMQLAEGTVIAASGMYGGSAFMYYCRPALVEPSIEHPQTVYYRRLGQLGLLPQYTVSAYLPAGTPVGTSIGQLWDDDFDYGMMRHVSAHEVSWVIVVGHLNSTGDLNAMNTLDEISDLHAMRFTGNILCPFRNGLRFNPVGFNGIWIQSGSATGKREDPTTDGYGHLIYQKLPAGW